MADNRKQLAVRLEPELYKAFAIALAKNGDKIQDVLIDAIREYIARTDNAWYNPFCNAVR